MKKNLMKVLALTFVLALALTFTGCGSKDNDASVPNSETLDTTPEVSDPSSPDESDETEEPDLEDKSGADDESDAADPSDNTGDSDVEGSDSNTDNSDTTDASDENEETDASGNMLEELVADPSMQEMAAQMSTDQYTAELLAENGNTLIYRFTLVEQLDLSDESISEVFIGALNGGLDSLASTYASILDTLRSELGMDDLIIRIEYLNADGTEILTRDFE